MVFGLLQFDGITFSHFFLLFVWMRSRAESAAEGADQLHVEGEGPRFELGHVEARLKHAFFSRQHVEIGRETMLVALAGEAIRLFKVGQRTARVREPCCELLPARRGVGSLVQRLNDLAVIKGHRLVILTAASAVLALERAAVEEGEAYRGAHASELGI